MTAIDWLVVYRLSEVYNRCRSVVKCEVESQSIARNTINVSNLETTGVLNEYGITF